MNTNLFKNKKMVLFIGCLFNIIYPILNVAFALTMKLIIDAGMSQNKEELKISIILCGVICVALSILSFLASNTKHIYSREVIKGLKGELFSKVIRSSYKNFNKTNSGSYISMLTSDIKKIEEDYLNTVFDLIRNFSLLIFALSAMIISEWRLAFMIIIACVIPIALSGAFSGKITRAQESSVEEDSKYTTRVKDMLSGFLVIKSFNVENQMEKEFEKANVSKSYSTYKLNYFNSLVIAISGLAGFLIFLVAFGGGMWLVLNGEITIGGITSIVQLVNFVVQPINEIGVNLNKFKAGKAVLKNMKIEYTSEKTDKDKFLKEFSNSIDIQNLSFGYNENEKILKNINMNIEKGKKYALVGISGSGKSTLINILLKLYDINENEGLVVIDGKDMKELSYENIYKLMTIVQQNVYIFDGDLKMNLTLNQNFDEESIWEAIKLSGLQKLVENNKMGLNMECGENGSKLSGGEKQRVSIARALLRKTPILFMDEATSSLDQKTSYEIEKSLLNIQDLTSVVITHKLNPELLKIYDKIMMLKDGEIIECGSFDELIENKEAFYNLYKVSNI